MSEYRYELTRVLTDAYWAPFRRTLCWVMLNPSTADETIDDPTIRRVKRFTADNGYDKLIVVNLFALRATKPAALLSHADPIGQHNPMAISKAFHVADDVVFAWGAWLEGKNFPRLRPELITAEPLCLGVTKHGSPRHPLYVKADQPLVRYQP